VRPSFVEAEPAVSPALTSHEVAVDLGGLEVGLHAKPIAGAAGWGFELRIRAHNTLESGVFDLGPRPPIKLLVKIADTHGGRGSGHRCAHSRVPADQAVRPLQPGERDESSLSWDKGVGAGERLSARVTLCPIRFPDNSSHSPEFATISMIVGPDARLETFELALVDLPD
jgi:hypothetical protein